ncbi:hypothetical protein OQA88_2173 [Cercophora sp. LCS_1]
MAQPSRQPEMISPTEDFTSLWERHLAAARKEFPLPATTTTNNNNTMSEIDRLWDESYNSVLSSLDDLTTSTQSPPPSTHEASTQGTSSSTAPSSPSSLTFPIHAQKPPAITISSPSSNTSSPSDIPPPTPMIEIGGRRSKGKELASYYLKQKRSPQTSAFKTSYLTPIPATPQTIPQQSQSHEPETPITSFRTLHRYQNPPPVEVHVLILTWAKHDRRGDDGQLLSPVLDIETDSVRNCFKKRGYKVQCRVIGEDYPTAAVETILGKFLQKAGEGRLLMVYYRGFGNLEGETEGQRRMVFSSGFGGSYFFWDDVRDAIMLAEGEVVMVMDCLAAPGAEQHEILMEPGLVVSKQTKQLLGVCAPYGVGGGYMAGVMCRALDGVGMLSVQGLCSRMREELRGEVVEESSVFVTQLGGGQLMDIYLPRFG